jgi:hypothetical protein
MGRGRPAGSQIGRELSKYIRPVRIGGDAGRELLVIHARRRAWIASDMRVAAPIRGAGGHGDRGAERQNDDR